MEAFSFRLNELPERVAELNTADQIVVHCKMGGRSSKAVEFLRSVGFRKVKNLVGGINAWADEVDKTLAKYWLCSIERRRSMDVILKVLPFVSGAVSLVFAFLVLRRYTVRHGLHLLLWGIGLIFYAVGGLCEALYGALGWSPVVFRFWYLFGAILVAAWLGQGTVYLWMGRRGAHILMIILGAASIYAAIRVIGAQLDPAQMTASLHTGSELSGHAIISRGVRSLTPVFNIYGTLALVGGAIWSAVGFARKRVLPNKVVGNVLIAMGALLPAFGGTFSRFGIAGALYLSELLGVILMFIGFLRAIAGSEASSK